MIKYITIGLILLIPYIGISQTNIDKCEVLPVNNIWNTRIDNLPVHPKSGDFINTIGSSLSLRNDFGSGQWNGAPIGIPYVLVGSEQGKTMVTFEYSDESDNVPYPIPEDPPIEGGNESTGDRHILIIDTSACILYELYSAYKNQDGPWRAGSGAVFDLNSNNLRPDTWTSADAAGLPIFPGLVKYEEVLSGEINHMIRFTVPKTKREYLWPARHYASSITDANYPPMGLVMRLRKSFDTEQLSPQAKVIAKALQQFGMILADNGSAWFMSGVPNENWDMDDLYTLRKIKGGDFEAVDVSSLMVDANSGEAKSNASSIYENIFSEGIEIFPNPASDYIDIAIKGEHIGSPLQGIQIFNTLGECVMAVETLHETSLQRLDISGLPDGVYLVVIENQNGKLFVKY